MGTTDCLVVDRTQYCSLSGACHVSRPLGFGAVDRWSLLSFATCRRRLSSDFWRCRLRAQSRSLPLVELIVAPRAHRTVRWFLVNEHRENLRAANLRSAQPGHQTLSSAHRIVRCTTGCSKSVVLHTCGIAPRSFSLYVYMNFMHLRKYQLGKLVSLYGLWWTSNTKIDYRVLRPFTFHIRPRQDSSHHRIYQLEVSASVTHHYLSYIYLLFELL
jgi:hypothetical protein